MNNNNNNNEEAPQAVNNTGVADSNNNNNNNDGAATSFETPPNNSSLGQPRNVTDSRAGNIDSSDDYPSDGILIVSNRATGNSTRWLWLSLLLNILLIGGGIYWGITTNGVTKWGNTFAGGGDIAVGNHGDSGDNGGGGGSGGEDNLCSGDDGSCKADNPSKLNDSGSADSSTEEDEDEKKMCQRTPWSKRSIPTSSPVFPQSRDKSEFPLSKSRVHKASKIVRGIIGNYHKSVVSILKEEKCLRNPSSVFPSKKKHFLVSHTHGRDEIVACDFVKEKLGLVYLFKPPEEEVSKKKIGSTKYPQKRCQYYQEKYEFFKPEQFQVLLRLKCISNGSLVKLYKILQSVINDIVWHPKVPEGQVRFFNAILERPSSFAKKSVSIDASEEEYSSLTTSESISSISDSDDDDVDVEEEIDLENLRVDATYRQWFRIAGVRNSLLLQLIEFCLQKEFGMEENPHSMAEAFSFPRHKYKALRHASEEMFDDTVNVIDEIIPSQEKVKVQLLSSWPPSKKPGKLYTFDVIMSLYGLNHLDPNMGWKDAIEHPVHHPWHDGLTIEQVYSKDYSHEDKDLADEEFCRFIRDSGFKSSAHPYSLLILDAQSWLYKYLVEPQKMLTRFNYSHVTTLKGGEIIIWKKQNTVLLLVGHPSKAGDASGNVLFEDMQRRGATVATVANVIRYVKGEFEEDNYDYTAVWAASVTEHMSENLHENNFRMNQALAFRDAILSQSNPHKSALSTFGGQMVKANNILTVSSYEYDDSESVLGSNESSDDDDSPADNSSDDSSTNQIDTASRKKKNRQLEWYDKVSKLVNSFSWSKPGSLHQELSSLKQEIEEKVNRHASHECSRWRRILDILSDFYQDSSLPKDIKSWADNKNLRFDIAVGGNCRVWIAVLEPTTQQTAEMKQNIDEWFQQTFQTDTDEEGAGFGYLVVRQNKNNSVNKDTTFDDFSSQLEAYMENKDITAIPIRSIQLQRHFDDVLQDEYTITTIRKDSPNHPLGRNSMEDIVTKKISRKVKETVKQATQKSMLDYFGKTA